MLKKVKLIIAAIGIITIIALVADVFLFMSFNRVRLENAAYRNELDKTLRQQKELGQKIEELEVVNLDLERQNADLSARYESLNNQYQSEKAGMDAIRLELNRKKQEIRNLNSQFRQETQEKGKLREMLDSEKSRYVKLKERVDKLIEVKDVLEEKVKDIINKQGVELERIVVKAEGELEGKILVVNRKYNFVVADIGFTDSLALGDMLTIFRSGKYVGEAQIEKIYDTMSAAAIVREIKPGAIMVDDNVVVRGN